ncbi:MAG TPA: polysaccharide biosynthesis C-terminal domain-containing protein, partial [Leptolinea sp.]
TNIGLNFLLIPRYSIFGAGIATTLSFMVQFICSYTLEKRFSGILQTNWGFPLKILAAALGMSLIILVFKTAQIGQPVLAILISAILGAMAYAGFLFLLGILNKSILQKGIGFILKEKNKNETN